MPAVVIISTTVFIFGAATVLILTIWAVHRPRIVFPVSVEASAAVAVLHAVLVANDAVNPLFGGGLMWGVKVEEKANYRASGMTHDTPQTS
jgi:hypothetical protein